LPPEQNRLTTRIIAQEAAKDVAPAYAKPKQNE
jgi:hypothetical protein